jgi:DNA-binding NtrC family response regulator
VRLSRPIDPPIIETFSAAAAGTLIGAAPSSNGAAHATPSPAAFAAAADSSGLPSRVCDGRLTLDEIERRSIVATLERFRGHRQKSAKALGIGVRTLGLKLKKWKEEALVPAEL